VVISLSAALLLAIVLVVMIRSKSIKVGPAIVAALFGFFLASTNMAPDINRFLNSVADTINQIKL
jgi:flagellar biosynthesis protein FliQ